MLVPPCLPAKPVPQGWRRRRDVHSRRSTADKTVTRASSLIAPATNGLDSSFPSLAFASNSPFYLLDLRSLRPSHQPLYDEALLPRASTAQCALRSLLSYRYLAFPYPHFHQLFPISHPVPFTVAGIYVISALRPFKISKMTQYF